jgi:hypothetical protein
VTLGRKDVAATVLTVLVVLVFAATRGGWDVWLVGGSHRWAAGAIAVLGMLTCGLGSSDRMTRGTATWLLAVLGTAALALTALALATGSLTVLALLVADIVALWAVSTLRHSRHVPRRPVAA